MISRVINVKDMQTVPLSFKDRSGVVVMSDNEINCMLAGLVEDIKSEPNEIHYVWAGDTFIVALPRTGDMYDILITTPRESAVLKMG